MKSLQESIVNEAVSAWKLIQTIVTKGFDMFTFQIMKCKEYGFLVYDEDSESVHLITADKPEDMADALSLEVEEVEVYFKLKVNEMERDQIEGHRIWRIW